MDLTDVVIKPYSEPATQEKQYPQLTEPPQENSHKPDQSAPTPGPNSIVDNSSLPLPRTKKMTDLLSNIFFAGFLLIAAGAALAFQAGCNSQLGKLGGRSFSSVFSFLLGLIAVVIYFAIDVLAFKTPAPDFRSLFKTAPWWAFLGGVLGAYYVIVNILTVPRLGAGTVLSVFVCSQIIVACLIDHFALVGVSQRDFTVWRGLGACAMIGGVIVVTLF